MMNKWMLKTNGRNHKTHLFSSPKKKGVVDDQETEGDAGNEGGRVEDNSDDFTGTTS